MQWWAFAASVGGRQMTEPGDANRHSLHGWRIGFAGLGLMGRPMARHLLSAGADLGVWNRTRAVADAFKPSRVQVCDSPADLAGRSDVVVLMLADTPVVEQVLFGPDGLAQGLRAGSLVIDMGTTAVMPTREIGTPVAGPMS